MKKLISLILALVMVLSLAACGSDTGASTANSASSAEGAPAAQSSDGAQPASGGDSFVIGMVDIGSTDATNKPLYDSAEQTVKALSSSYIYATMEENSADGVLNAVNNLISTGIDGLVVPNMASMFGIIPTIADLCEQNGVYFTLFWTSLEEGTPEYDACMNNPYFISTTCEDDVYSGYWATKVIGELGDRKSVV